MLGLGISPIRKGVGLVQEGGRHSDPFWVACLLACSLAVFISLCWTCTSGLTFACPRQSSLFAFVEPALFTPLRLANRAKPASLSVPFRFGTTPAPSPSPTLPRLPPQNLPQALHARPPKRGPLDLAAARANQQNSISSIGPHQGKPSRVRPPHRKRPFCVLKLNPRSTGHPAQFWDPRPTKTRPPPPRLRVFAPAAPPEISDTRCFRLIHPTLPRPVEAMASKVCRHPPTAAPVVVVARPIVPCH